MIANILRPQARLSFPIHRNFSTLSLTQYEFRGRIRMPPFKKHRLAVPPRIRPETSPKTKAKPENTIFVMNLRDPVNRTELIAAFEEFGTVLDVRIGRKTGSTTCRAKIAYRKASQATRAVKSSDVRPIIFDSKYLKVILHDETRTIYDTLKVEGITSDKEIRSILEDFDVIKTTPFHGSPRLTFVDFDSAETAGKAMKKTESQGRFKLGKNDNKALVAMDLNLSNEDVQELFKDFDVIDVRSVDPCEDGLYVKFDTVEGAVQALRIINRRHKELKGKLHRPIDRPKGMFG